MERMAVTQPVTYGIDARALGPKLFLTFVHLAALLASAWLLLGGGIEMLAPHLGVPAYSLAPLLARWLLVGCAGIYFLRLLLTVFHLLKRKMSWSEAMIVAVWVSFIHLAFAVAGGTNPRTVWFIVQAGVVLYLAGSWMNTFSEWQRKAWKERPENRGYLYTGGLFRYAMHINYFGDLVLFTGYALVTGRPLALLVPLLMVGGFVFLNIPTLDSYLKRRYGAEFYAYACRTRKLVPFVY